MKKRSPYSIRNNGTAERANATSHNNLFHANTFEPSSGGKGIRLNIANHKLISIMTNNMSISKNEYM